MLKRRRWTHASALAWVEGVKAGRYPQGLKYCSAVDFLRNLCGVKVDG